MGVTVNVADVVYVADTVGDTVGVDEKLGVVEYVVENVGDADWVLLVVGVVGVAAASGNSYHTHACWQEYSGTVETIHGPHGTGNRKHI